MITELMQKFPAVLEHRWTRLSQLILESDESETLVRALEQLKQILTHAPDVTLEKAGLFLDVGDMIILDLDGFSAWLGNEAGPEILFNYEDNARSVTAEWLAQLLR